jgi:hypothetical protein
MPTNFDLERLRGAAVTLRDGESLVHLVQTPEGWNVEWNGKPMSHKTPPVPLTFSTTDAAIRYLQRHVAAYAAKTIRATVVIHPATPMV